MKRAYLTVIAVMAGIVLGVLPAAAYCVYNDTQQHIFVNGEFCGSCLNTGISPNNKACCPGDKKGCRGETWINVVIPNTPYQTSVHYAHTGAQVPAHGWVRIFGADQMLQGKVYDAKGKLLWSGLLIKGKKE